MLNLSSLGSNSDGLYLRWSPGGKRILLYNSYGDSNIDVWNVTRI